MAHAAPVVRDLVELRTVGGLNGDIQHVEARREAIRRALEQHLAAQDHVLDRRRALGRSRLRVEHRHGLDGDRAARTGGRLRAQRQLRLAVVVQVAEREGEHVAADRRIGSRLAIDLCAAALIFQAFGQHQHHASGADRQLRDIQLRGVQQLRRTGDSGFELQGHAAPRHQLAREHEITAPQRAAANVDELRIGAAGVAHGADTTRQLMRIGNRDGIHLHDVRARRDVFEVILAFVVGDRVTAVFEIDANTRHTLQLLRRTRAVAFDDAAHDDRAIAEQLFAQLNRRLRRVGRQAVGADRPRGVHELLAARAGSDLDDVADFQALPRAERAADERQGAAVGGNLRIGRDLSPNARRAGVVARAERQLVDDAHARNRGVGRGVLDSELVLNEVADRSDGRRGRLLHEQLRRGRIERNVDGDSGRSVRRERSAERAGTQAIRAAGRQAELGDAERRRECMAGRRVDCDSITARRDQREAEHTGGQRVDRAAAVGHGRAGEHFGRVAAHAVVAEDSGRHAGGRIDQPHARTVDRRAGARIEDQAVRIDQRTGTAGVGCVDRVDVERLDLRVALDFEHAVAGGDRDRTGLDVTDEDAGVRAGLGDAQRLCIAARRAEPHIEIVDDGRIAILVRVHHSHERRLAAVQRCGRRERNRLRRIERRAVGLQRRRQRHHAARAAALSRARHARRAAAARRAQDRHRRGRRRRSHDG